MQLVNEQIKNRKVKLVGDYTGEMSLSDALNLAYSKKLDLVEMADNEGVSVCKIFDYNKFLYTQKKARKVQKKLVIKEIRFGCNIADHDLKVSQKKAQSILNEGARLKVSVFFKGRQMMFMNTKGPKLIEAFMALFDEGSIRVVSAAKQEGNLYTMMIEATDTK